MGLLNDFFNIFLADSITPNGGDRYLMYTLFRDDIAMRIKKEKLERERIEYEKEREKRLKEIKHLKFLALDAQNAATKASENHRKAIDNLKHVYLSTYLGCDDFEEMCDRMELNTKESWDKLVDALPHFSIFNEDHEKYLKKLNSKE